ncbi:50S ribosomal protein L25/general stress protein Ctc [Corynebacterium sp. L4756]|uniref:50S ribosomal protein L25/general stress protein Ctc n=1 Tax=unclassified Corynebacterium TaxID=2624378 RepID=UPI00374D13CF
MAQRPVIKAQARNEFGKGAARRLRRAGLVPGVIYGSNTEPIHFAAPILELHTLIRYHGANAVLELEIDGEQHLTMVKDIFQNVLTLDMDHLDLLSIKRGEKVEVEVPVTLTGEPAPGMMSIADADVLMVEADVLNIPDELVVSIEGLEDGTVVTAADVTLPEGTTLVADPETPIVSISEPQVDEEIEAAAEAAEEGGADAGAESAEDAESESK